MTSVKARAGTAHGTGVAPGPAIIRSSKISSHSTVSQATIKKLRTIGADSDSIEFAERHAAKA